MARLGLVVEVAPGLPLGLDLCAGITAEGSSPKRPGPQVPLLLLVYS